MLWDEGAFEPDQRRLQLFMPWFFHCWSPYPVDTALRDPTLHDFSPTQAYLARRGRSLDPLLRSYLDAYTKAPLSFHEVLRCDPGRGARLHDVMTGALACPRRRQRSAWGACAPLLVWVRRVLRDEPRSSLSGGVQRLGMRSG